MTTIIWKKRPKIFFVQHESNTQTHIGHLLTINRPLKIVIIAMNLLFYNIYECLLLNLIESGSSA